MEVFIEVFSEDIPNNIHFKSHEAYITYVALDENANPFKVPELTPENDIEKKAYQEALNRRQLRLILAGKISPKDAPDVLSGFQNSKS